MAGNKIGLVLALDNEAGFKKGISECRKETNLFDSQLRALSETYRDSGNSTEYLTQKQTLLKSKSEALANQQSKIKAAYENANKTFREQSKNLEKLEKELEEAKKAQEKMAKAGDTSSKEYKEQEKEVERLTKAVDSQNKERDKSIAAINRHSREFSAINKKIDKHNSELEKTERQLKDTASGTNKSAKAVDKFGKEIRETDKDVEDLNKDLKETSKGGSMFGDMLKANVGADAIKKGVEKTIELAKEAAEYVVEVGSNFEAAMDKVQAISGASAAEMENLSEKARELGASTMFSATEAAESFQYMSLAGWSTEQMLSSIEGVLNLSAASGMDLAAASDVVTDTLSAFGLQAKDSAHLVDMMALAQASSNTSAAQLGEAYANSATRMRAAGQSAETVTAILAGMANVGDKGASAGTKLAAVMAQISAKMVDGKISIGEASVAVTDAEGNFRNFIDIFKDIESATAGMGSAELTAALGETFNRTSMAAITEILAAGVDNIEAYEASMYAANGTAEKMADTMQDNLKGAVTELGSATEGLGITVYDYVKEPLTGAVNFMTESVTFLDGILKGVSSDADEIVKKATAAVELAREAAGLMPDYELEAASQEMYVQRLGSSILAYMQYGEASGITSATFAANIQLLGQYVPEVSEAFDEQTGSLRLTTRELSGYIAKGMALAKNNVWARAAQENSQAIGDATQNIAAAEAANANMLNKQSFFEKWLPIINEINTADTDGMFPGIPDGLFDDFLADVETARINGWLLDDEYKTIIGTMETWGTVTGRNGSHETIKQLSEYLNGFDISNAANIDATADAVSNLSETSEQLSENQQTYVTNQNEATEAIEEANAALEEATRYGNKVRWYQDYYSRGAEQQTDATEGLTDAMEDLGDEEEDVADSANNVTKALTAIEDAEQNLAANTQGAATAQKNAVDSVHDAYSSFRDELEADIENKISLFDGFDGGNDMTVESINANLEAQKEGLLQYRDDMEYLANEVGNTITPEFFQYLMSLGPEGANTARHMVITLTSQGEEGEQLIRDMCQNWADAFDISDEIAYNVAADDFAIRAGAKELGSSSEEFANVGDAISEAMASDTSGWIGVTDSMKAELDDAISLAQNMGIKIPDGLADGIRSGNISYQNALGQIKGATQGQMQSIIDWMKDSGANVPEALEQGIANGSPKAIEAFNDMMSQMAAGTQVEDVNVSGFDLSGIPEAVGEAVSNDEGAITEKINAVLGNAVNNADVSDVDMSGVTDGMGDSIAAGEEGIAEKIKAMLVKATIQGAPKQADMASTGLAIDEGIASGVTSNGGLVGNATGQVVFSSASTAQGSTGSFQNVGVNIDQGLAIGINSGAYLPRNAIHNVMLQAINQAKATINSHSPSRVFMGIGGFIDKGLEIGITGGKKDVVKATADLAQSTIDTAQDVLDIHSPSKKFQKAVGLQVTKGFAKGIKEGKKQTSAEAEKMSSDVFNKATKWLAAYKKKHKVTLSDEKYFWTQMQKRAKKGTTGYSEISKRIAKATVDYGQQMLKKVDSKLKNNFNVSKKDTKGKDKSAATYYGEVYNKAKTYIDNIKKLHNLSDEEELKYWQKVVKKLKKGTQAWIDATATIKNLQKSIADDKKDQAAQKIKDTYSNQGSILDTYKAYYQYSKGMNLSLKAEMQYYDKARQKFKVGTEERMEADAKYIEARAAYYDAVKDLDEQYASDYADIQKDMEEQIQSLTDEYENAVKERQDAILGSMDLFEAFDSTGYGADTLIYNLKTQVAGLQMWEEQLEALKNKGISTDLYEYLAEQGPDAAANIYSLANATQEQLGEYQALFDARNALARDQAVKDNADMLADTNQKINQAKKDAKTALDELNAEYKESVKEINTEIDKSLLDLLEKAGKVGTDAISMLFTSMQNAVKTDNGGRVAGTKEAITTSLGTIAQEGQNIGKETVDELLNGMNDQEAIAEGTDAVVDSIARAFHDSIEKRQAEMASELSLINDSGINMLNSVTTDMSGITPVVNVNNDASNGILAGIAVVMGEIASMMSSGIRLDDDTIIGRFQPLFSQYSANVSTRLNRGTL